jgi:PAS domain S-box-containing protein
MPHFSAPEALNILKEGGVTLPFIIISGSIGAELAVSLMRAGAHDWISKDDISRLVPAVERELEEVMTLQKQKEIITVSEEKFRTLANSTTDWIYWIDPKGRCVYTSPSALGISGYGPEEYLSNPDLLIHMIHPDDTGRFQKHLTECTSPLIVADPCEIEFRILKKDGDVRWISHTCGPIVDKNNQFLGRRASNRDITNRKRAEKLLHENEEKYRLLVETMNDVVFTLDFEGGIVDTSPTMKKVIGWSREELIGKSFSDLVHPDDIRIAEEEYLRAIQGIGRPIEIRVISLDGTVRWVRINALLIMKDGEPENLMCTLSDITERKKDEMLLAVQSDILTILARSSLNSKEIAQRIVDVLKLATGFDAVGIRLQERDDYPFVASIGYSDEFLLAENTLTMKYPEGGLCRDKDGNVSLECTCGLLISGKADPANPLFTPGGSAWTNDSLPFLDVPLEQDPRLHPRNRCIHVGFRSLALVPLRAGDNIMGLMHLACRRTDCFTDKSIRFFEGIGVSIGIALERKEGEELLRDSEKKYRLLVDSAAEAIMVGQDGMIRLVNPMVTAITGFSEQEIMSKPFQLFVHPDDRVMLMGHHERRLRGEPVTPRYAFRLIAKDGSTKWLEMSGVSIKWEGRPATLNFMTDFTERKKAQDQLASAHKGLEEAHHLAHIGAWDWLIEGDVVTWSEELHDIAGTDSSLPAPTFAEHSRHYTPTSWERLSRAVKGALTTGESYNLELELVRPDGSKRWGIAVGGVKRDGEGKVIGLHGILQDITERKLAEDALRLKDLAIVSSINAIAISDMSGNLTYVNPAFLKIWGLEDQQEVLGRSVLSFWKIPDQAQQAIEGLHVHGNWLGEMIGQRKDGPQIDVQVAANLVRDSSGTPVAMMAAFIDITERKRAEHDASKRMKELRAFYSLAEIAAREGITLVELYQEFVKVLHKSWQYPEITCAMIVVGDEHFLTENYRESAWKQSASIKVDDVARGSIEIRYLEERPEEDEGPFLKEERLLIDSLAERLGRIIEQTTADEALIKRTEDADDAKVKARTYFDFLAHDMANLLSPVLAYAELISLDAKTPEPSKIKAGKIADQARRASSFILSLRRLEDLELTTQERMESRDLGTILDEAVTRVKAEYEDKHISATVVHTDEPVKFMGGKHLESIIIGILENSVAVADRDEIALEVKATLVRENGHKFLMLELTDDGPGITDDLKGCFIASTNPRQQFEVGIVRGVASTLLVSSAIVNNLGGALRIEDRIPGDCSKGSRIIIKFPQEGFFGT